MRCRRRATRTRTTPRGQSGQYARSGGLEHRTELTHPTPVGGAGDYRLPPEPRPPTDTEPRLQRLVLLSVLHCSPDEQADYEDGGEDDQDADDNQGRDAHAKNTLPAPSDIKPPLVDTAGRGGSTMRSADAEVLLVARRCGGDA